MLYKIVPQYPRGGTNPPIAQFKTINDAKLFIQAKLTEDMSLKIDAKYQLLEGMDEVQVFTQQDAENDNSSSSSSGSQQRSSGQSFQPTPFNSAPRPTGMPPSWMKDEDDKKK